MDVAVVLGCPTAAQYLSALLRDVYKTAESKMQFKAGSFVPARWAGTASIASAKVSIEVRGLTSCACAYNMK